ncbi:integrase [Mycobacterium lehmannii]|uniref:Integrase n=1 Tax=Mycobacterium lehmannii TaxID=2048550 RepID=A0A101A4R9_9MYCO|nr:site-specific integrase [Mycobacterium lehmannii]KUI13394.1 integrase [Mycobacterium lehmannii]
MKTRKRPARRSWGLLRQLPSGNWQASYTGPDAIRHVAPHTFSTKLAAEGWLANERRLVEAGAWSAPAVRAAEKAAGGTTVAEYARQWIAQRPGLKYRTRKGYEAVLRNRIEGTTLGDAPLKALTPPLVRTWYASLPADRPTARAHAYQFLHAVCATAVVDGLLAANPCHITKAMANPPKRQPVIPTPAQVAVLADAMPARLRMEVLLAAWCGPRWGELVELRRKDVAVDCSTITIARGAVHRSGECHIDTPKSGKGRKVVVPPHIRADLARHLMDFVGAEPNAQLFPAAQGGCHLNDRVNRDYFAAACAAVGIEGMRWHDLRHFAGTMAAQVGNLREVMDRLGHSTVRAAMIYQGLVDNRDAEVADALSKLATG